MIYILVANQKFMSFLKLAAAAIVGLLLSTSMVQAAGPYPWSDQPEYQRTPGDYSTDQADQFNSRARQNAQAYDQMERYRQESIRQERERQAAAPPANANPYNFPEAVITPRGTMLCQKSFNTTICQ